MSCRNTSEARPSFWIACVAMLASVLALGFLSLSPTTKDRNLIVWFGSDKSDASIFTALSDAHAYAMRRGPLGHSFVIRLSDADARRTLEQNGALLTLRAPQLGCNHAYHVRYAGDGGAG
ncbi:MAG: hypothetical protein JO126_01100 [Alphaproteobacteria bacterium]|nr:hypothetical protein [Alphaproteobacteria bacterium]